MKFFDRLSDALSWRLAYAGRTRARLDLLKRSDRFLADNGFSRELLEQGNAAWPWQAFESAPSSVPQPAAQPADLRGSTSRAPSHVDYARAEAELHAMSDAELSDLDIVRTDIAAVVRDGRPGVDEPAPRTDEQKAA